MGFGARILADSIGPNNIPRLTTFEVTFPRPFLAEFNTHRVFSRNSASSRAIPVEKMIERVMKDPYIPTSWGKNQKGMQAGEEVNEFDAGIARIMWLDARNVAVKQAEDLAQLGIHKQLTNRLLEPFMWHTCIVSSTEWSNFFHLRNNPMAQPEIQTIACMMQELYAENVPDMLDYEEWHLPLISHEDYALAFATTNTSDSNELMGLMTKVSVGRCARVSYLTHDGKRDLRADVELHDALLKNGHMSPFEHVARPAHHSDESKCTTRYSDIWYEPVPVDGAQGVEPKNQWFGNFRGWVQYRTTIPGESDIIAHQQQESRNG